MSRGDAVTLPARPEPGSYVRDDFFAGGAWMRANGDTVLPVFDCGTEAELGRIRSAGMSDVDFAVVSAQDAQPGWAALAPAERGRYLLALRAELERRSDELTAVIAAEVGTAVGMCGPIQVASSVRMIQLMAELAASESFEEEIANTTVVRRPVGVVAAITPWNYPLFQTASKLGGALAAGCTLVHKPSELAPLSAFILADAVAAAGLPAGVYNLVPGTGPSVGEALARHPGVRMVSFTGSTTAGTRVYELAAGSLKRVALELGGKSASVLLPDADLGVAVKASVNRAFLNSGQTCDAWTRLVVPRDRLGDVMDQVTATVARLTLGDQFDAATKLGPLISDRQLRRVRGYIEGALRGGARAAIGGPDRPDGLERGHFARPTVLTQVTPDMTVAQEEVFGPVLSVLTYDTVDEAVTIANGTRYGLSGAVWSADPEHALAFAKQMEAGQVVINGGRFNPLAPFGGIKLSGLGREMGRYGIEEFLEPVALQH